MKTLIRRHLLPHADELLGVFPALVVQGARQVGKSTFAQMLLADRPHLSVSLDDVDIAEAARLDPRAFVSQAGSGTLVIDEVQRDPALLLAVKSAIDADRRPGRFVMTGSSDLLRLSRTPDSLAGRAVTVDLHGLSQGELAGRPEDFGAWVERAWGTEPATVRSSWSRSHYVSALTRGGYPDVRDLSDRLRAVWFDSYVDRLLTRDAYDVSRGLSSDRLSAVLRLVAANQGGELVPTRLADALSIPKSVISTYLAALSTLYLTNDLPPWGPNLTKREIGRHKVAVADSGLATRLARLRPAALESLTAATAFGAQLEAFVAAELTKQRGWSAAEYDLYHFRDRNGLEVDLVIEYDDGRVFLIEVKASSTYRSDHVRGIRQLADRLGDRFIGGAVLGLSTEPLQLAQGIWGLPISVLWEHP
ncbi:MAG: ATP-binding protein [Micropruina sp.]|uniref:ATP-binding protein n=1 Tax=Micropruina sp. TaxID=2737536 RepID=UPI0039E322F7